MSAQKQLLIFTPLKLFQDHTGKSDGKICLFIVRYYLQFLRFFIESIRRTWLFRLGPKQATFLFNTSKTFQWFNIILALFNCIRHWFDFNVDINCFHALFADWKNCFCQFLVIIILRPWLYFSGKSCQIIWPINWNMLNTQFDTLFFCGFYLFVFLVLSSKYTKSHALQY